MVGIFSPDLRLTKSRPTIVHLLSRLRTTGPRVNRKRSDQYPFDGDSNGRGPAVWPAGRRAEEKSGEALAELADCYRGILVGIGEDPTRHGLRQTPERAARAMLYFTKGYDEKIEG